MYTTKEHLAYLPMSYRLPLILEEIDYLDPDILLLQEKQRSDEATLRELKARGYKVTNPTNRDSHSRSTEDRHETTDS